MGFGDVLDRLKGKHHEEQEGMSKLEERINALDSKVEKLSVKEPVPQKAAPTDASVLRAEIEEITGLLSDAIKIEVAEKEKINHLEKLYSVITATLENIEARVEKIDAAVKDPENKEVIVMHDPELEKIKVDVEKLKKSAIMAADK